MRQTIICILLATVTIMTFGQIRKDNYTYDKEVIDDLVLYNTDNEGLKLLRNEIYARNGYIFKNKDLKIYFETKNWYTPQYENVDSKLNKIERMNIARIRIAENFIISRKQIIESSRLLMVKDTLNKIPKRDLSMRETGIINNIPEYKIDTTLRHYKSAIIGKAKIENKIMLFVEKYPFPQASIETSIYQLIIFDEKYKFISNHALTETDGVSVESFLILHPEQIEIITRYYDYDESTYTTKFRKEEKRIIKIRDL